MQVCAIECKNLDHPQGFFCFFFCFLFVSIKILGRVLSGYRGVAVISPIYKWKTKQNNQGIILSFPWTMPSKVLLSFHVRESVANCSESQVWLTSFCPEALYSTKLGCSGLCEQRESLLFRATLFLRHLILCHLSFTETVLVRCYDSVGFCFRENKTHGQQRPAAS